VLCLQTLITLASSAGHILRILNFLAPPTPPNEDDDEDDDDDEVRPVISTPGEAPLTVFLFRYVFSLPR